MVWRQAVFRGGLICLPDWRRILGDTLYLRLGVTVLGQRVQGVFVERASWLDPVDGWVAAGGGMSPGVFVFPCWGMHGRLGSSNLRV